MKHIVTIPLLLATSLAGSLALAQDTQPCLPKQELSLNGVKFFGPSAAIEKNFGKPERIKKWLRKSDGNEGNYYVNDYIYKDVVFSARIGKGKDDRVQKIEIKSPALVLGKSFHVGMSGAEVAKALNFKGKLKLEKSALTVFQCDDDAGSVFLKFGFDKKDAVQTLVLEYDSDSI
jgi:hypothetical protein